MTAKEVCEYLEITLSTFYKWKKGQHKVPKMAKLALRGRSVPEFLR
jgi:predicted site-specific integrase-resolvase